MLPSNSTAIKQTLRHLEETLPQAPEWAAVLTNKGSLLSHVGDAVDVQRVALMAKASLDLCARTSSALNNGSVFRYVLVVGHEGSFLMLRITDQHLLGLNFRQELDIDVLFKAMWPALGPLLSVLMP